MKTLKKLIVVAALLGAAGTAYPGTFTPSYEYNVLLEKNLDMVGYNVSYDTTNYRVTYSTDVSATKFFGDGSALTGVVATSTGNVDNVCRESTGTLKVRLDQLQIDTATLASVDLSKMADSPSVIASTHIASGAVTESKVTAWKLSLSTGTTGKVPDTSLPVVSLTTATMGLIPDVQIPKISLSTATVGNLPDAQMYKISLATASTGNLPDSQMFNLSLSSQVTGLLPQSNMGVAYSTVSIYVSFVDTTAVNLMGLTYLARLPYNAILKGAHIGLDASGTGTVTVTTGTSLASMGASIIISTAGSQQGDVTVNNELGKEMPVGTWLKFLVTAQTTAKEIYAVLDLWKR